MALEVYVEFGRTADVKVFGGKVESVVTAEPRGLGVRTIDDGRVGYSYTADLSAAGLDRVILESLDNARASGRDEYQALPGPVRSYPAIEDVWRPGVAAASMDAKIAIALEAEARALARPKIVTVEISQYSDAESDVAIVSSEGIEAQGKYSFALAYAFALAAEEDERQSGLGFTVGREPRGSRSLGGRRRGCGQGPGPAGRESM